jgi:hypothetical protein
MDFAKDAVAVDAAKCSESIHYDGRFDSGKESSMLFLHLLGVSLVEAPNDIERCLFVVHKFDERLRENVIPATVGGDD